MTAEAAEPPTQTPNEIPDARVPTQRTVSDADVGAAVVELTPNLETEDPIDSTRGLVRVVDTNPDEIADLLSKINVGQNPTNTQIIEAFLSKLMHTAKIAHQVTQRMDSIGRTNNKGKIVLDPDTRYRLIEYVRVNFPDDLLGAIAESTYIEEGHKPTIQRAILIILAFLNDEEFERFRAAEVLEY